MNKEKQAKMSPLPYKIDDVVKLGGTDYEIWDISSEPYVQFDDGSLHYALTVHLVGGSCFDLMFINDAQIDLKEDDE